MARKNVLKRSMFQMGGAAFGEPPLPTAPPMGGGIVEGLGLNAPDPMPTAPPTPSPAEQQAISGGIESLTGMLGQIEGADDTQSLINAMRGDEKTVDERYTELAKYVGREDATATPESVLTLVQPTFELLDQAETGGAMMGLSSDMLEPSAPPPVEETMSLTETETITEPVQGFQWGGFAAKKSNTPVYRQDGSPPWGEVNPYTQGAPQGKRILGGNLPTTYNPQPNPYVNVGATLTDDELRRQTYPTISSLSDRMTEQTQLDQLLFPGNRSQATRAASPSFQTAVIDASLNVPEKYGEANVRNTMSQSLGDAKTSEELYNEAMGLAGTADILAEEDSSVIQNQIDALLGPSKEEAKTAEELYTERQEFMGMPEDKGAAAFALAKYFSEMANTPGTFLQSATKPAGELADTLRDIGREKSLLEYQGKGQAWDEHKALLERIRQDERGIAEKAFDVSQSNIQGNKGFKQGVIASSLQEAALQARTLMELETNIREFALKIGADWSNSTMSVLAKMYEPLLETRYEPDGRAYGNIINPQTGVIEEVYIGFRDQEFGNVFNIPNKIRADDPTWVGPESLEPHQMIGNMPAPQVADIKERMYRRNIAIDEAEEIIGSGMGIETGPASAIRSFATNTAGALGAKYYEYIGTEAGKARIREWVRKYIAAEALSDRYALGEQELIRQIPDLDQVFFNTPDAGLSRFKTLLTGMLNTNEYDHALFEGRAPAHLVYLATGVKNDPLDWSRPEVRDVIGLMEEQGRTGQWHVRMNAEEATLQDPAINPRALTSIEDVRAQYDPESPQYRADLDQNLINKYDRFAEKGNELVIPMTLLAPAQGSEVSILDMFNPYEVNQEEIDLLRVGQTLTGMP